MKKRFFFSGFLIVMISLGILAFGQEDRPFFLNWEPAEIYSTPYGFIVIVLNPNPLDEIKIVVVATDFEFHIIAYWFCKGGKVYVYQFDGEKFIRNPELEKEMGCPQNSPSI